jgi:ferredoxin-type protein NapF
MDSFKGRRAFLLGRSAVAAAVRPPWSLPEAEFIDRCTRCNDCLKACPNQIIVIGDGGFPSIDFSLGECTFCGDCVNACTAGAFDINTPAPWHLHIQIDDSCLASHQTFCMACIDACPEQAIRLRYTAAVPVPEIDTSLCTGCGACLAPCPTQAISLHPIETAASP